MKKFSKIFGIAAALSMLASLMIVAAPASAADPLQWNAAGGMPSVNSDTNNEIRTGSDVSDIAIAGDNSAIWVTDKEGSRAFVSTDGGKKWTLKSAATVKVTNPTFVAIAPDDPDILIIADVDEVAVSTNGGTSFSTLSSATLLVTAIMDVAISPASSGVHYIAVAGQNVGGTAELDYFNLGSSVPSWTSTGGGLWDATAMNGDVSVDAIAFSPAFASDQIITVVTENVSKAFFEIASFSTKKWNSDLGFTDYNGATNQLGTASALTSAQIALYPTYLGADDQERKGFVALAGTNGGLFRMNDATDTQISSSTITSAQSVAFDGTNIVVGASANNVVWSSSNPTANSPTVVSTNVYQRPGGASMVNVAWLGSTVLAGTSGANSAFAVSPDNGVTFNDISLVDSSLTSITDFQQTADGGTRFVVANDGTYDSIWKKVSRWERIFSQLATLSSSPDIIRLAPGSANNVYVADLGGQQLFYSSDGGETKWSIRSLPATPVDIAVESNEVAYALSAIGNVYKTTNAGFIWGSPKATGIDGASIVSLGTDLVLVGGASGGVAWSTDGNASSTTWTNKTAVTGGGAMQVTASGLADGDFIYAAGSADAKDVVRWKLGTSTSWDDIIAGNTGNFTGLVLSDGVLYAISVDTVGLTTDVLRTLSPTTAKSTTSWDSVRDSSKVANALPRSLTVTTGTGSQNLWVINTNGTPGIRTFEDTLYAAGPSQNSPSDGGTIQVNPVSGGAYQVVISWARISLATSYSLQVAYDSAFTQLLTSTITVNSGAPTVVSTLSATGANPVQLDPGVTYFWRVKATAPVASPYSATRTFILEELAAPPPPFVISSPVSGVSNVSTMPLLTWAQYPGAIRYEVALSEDPSFAIVEWVRNVDNNFYGVEEALKYSTTYYWRVRGVTGERVGTGPVPAGPWATGVFQTMAEPAAPTTTPAQPTATVIVTQPGTTTVVEVPTQTPAPIPAYLLWLVIIIGAILIIALIVLIVRTRRVA